MYILGFHMNMGVVVWDFKEEKGSHMEFEKQMFGK